MEFLIQLVLTLSAIFIILLVLVQRGRGGGLAGAFGGAGGSSAFGAKAGDVFTKITMYSVTIWIILCVLATYWANNRGDAFGKGGGAFAGGNKAETTIDLGALQDAQEGAEEPSGEEAAPVGVGAIEDPLEDQ